jgi:hypothetical protein
MCWSTRIKKYASQKDATEDIKTFKVVTKDNYGHYIPYYYGIDFSYEVGRTHRHTKPIHIDIVDYSSGLDEQNEIYEINEGLHSYNCDKVKLIWHPHICQFAVESKYQWTYYTADSYLFSTDLYKMNCIIPAGTTYYENEYGEIVSNVLKVLSIDELMASATNKE